MRKAFCFLFLLNFVATSAFAGLDIIKSNGITLTGADGINYIGTSGITLTGADGFLTYRSNGITLRSADGITLTGADRVTNSGPDGVSYVGPNGITLTGADGITLTGADGITLTGADGITLTGADGTQYHADSIVIRRPNGITLTGADGITLTGADGIALTGADGSPRPGVSGITLTGADGIDLRGADGITLTGADRTELDGAESITGFNSSGIAFDLVNPAGVAVVNADGITLTGADGITLTGADGIIFRQVDGITLTGADGHDGLQSVDPELALALNNATDDSSLNAVVVYHGSVTDDDLDRLRQLGILGGTKFRMLPMVYITGTRSQIIELSRLPQVRSIYGNRTLSLNSDPYFKTTGVQRVNPDNDLRAKNNGLPVSGKNVTVAVMDTGINSNHADLAGKVTQNVKVGDIQSVPAGFVNPTRVENVTNTDLVSGHGTFVSGIVAGSGLRSGGKYEGIAPGARLLGLGVGDVTLTHVLSGFDYLLEKGPAYNVKVVNCSFSANTVYDENDPVNIATRMLTDGGVSVVVSAGNTGPGSGTLNPYASAPWVIGVGATDQNGVLAGFSSRGSFGSEHQPLLTAPGVNVASIRSLPTTTGVSGLGGADTQRLSLGEMPFYTTASGTSFSAPQVAGAIALMLEANPSLTPAAVKDILGRSATPMPRYFYHEAGAGMLNTHAAVLEAAFPDRRMGSFRSTISQNSLQFVTEISQNFTDMVFPGTARSVSLPIAENVVRANISVAWGMSANDFGLKVYDANNGLAGESNYLNLPGLAGRRESVVLPKPSIQAMRAEVRHTAGTGTAQNVYGAVETTTVEYPVMADISALSQENLAEVETSLLTNVMFPLGRKFRPDSPVSRYDLAAVFVRAGLVSQYLSAATMFTDTRDRSTRTAVESVQSRAEGKLFYDASAGGPFQPNNSTSRVIAAVAFVKAANLDNAAATSSLPTGIADAASIPTQWRGYVAVALQKGYLTLSGDRFEPNRALTRIEMSRAVNTMIR